jgi:hypothetical protein
MNSLLDRRHAATEQRRKQSILSPEAARSSTKKKKRTNKRTKKTTQERYETSVKCCYPQFFYSSASFVFGTHTVLSLLTRLVVSFPHQLLLVVGEFFSPSTKLIIENNTEIFLEIF